MWVGVQVREPKIQIVCPARFTPIPTPDPPSPVLPYPPPLKAQPSLGQRDIRTNSPVYSERKPRFKTQLSEARFFPATGLQPLPSDLF